MQRFDGDLAAAIACAKANPDKLTDVGAVPSPMPPEQVADFIAAARSEWSGVVKASGATAD